MTIPASPGGPPNPGNHPLQPVAGQPSLVPLAYPVGAPVGPRALAPTVLSPAPNAWTLLTALRRRWMMALSLGIIAAAAVATPLWLLLPPAKTNVIAMLHVDAKRPSIADSSQTVNAVELQMYQKTQVAMVKSRLVLNAALRRPKVADLDLVHRQSDAALYEWLDKKLKVDFNISPEIMSISLEGHESDQIKLLIDAITAAYTDEVVERERSQTLKTHEQLQEFIRRYEDRIKRTRGNMRRLKQEMGASDPQALALLQQASQAEFSMANQDLGRIHSEIRQVKSQLTAFENPKGTPMAVPEGEVQAVIERDDLVRKYSARQMQLEEQIESFRKVAVQGERDPLLQNQLREYEKVKQSILRRRQELQLRLEEEFRERGKLSAKDQHARLRQRLEMLVELEKQTAAEVARLGEASKRKVKGGLDLDDYAQEIAHLEDILKSMKARNEKLEMELEAPGKRVQLLQEATVYPANEMLWRGGISGAAAAAALFAILMLVAYIEFRSRRIASVAQLTTDLGVNVVGTLPVASGRRARDVLWQRQLMESVDAARTLLLRMAAVENLQVVMVASATSGEGKTSLACHLATSLARAGRKTLLLDGDLRKPAAHKVFQLPDHPGLCELLRGELAPEQVVQETSLPGLSLVAAGRCDEAALQFLANYGLNALFNGLRGKYDFIIIDSSPVLPIADGLILAQHADGVLFSVMQHVSRTPKVYAACQRLAAVGARLLGAVMTGGQEDVYGAMANYGAGRNVSV